ncbi:hypothetical protein F5Y16DRAFT_418119 [Xylariaceae sp. FL0255]|nr:hypothetical protein F5Y16DRAFT_418119 [Xylariaceae sp. FL0255]
MELSSFAILANTEFDIDCAGPNQYISVGEVEAITALRETGIQKLRVVSRECITSFYTPITLSNGHIAATVIRTIPQLDPPSRNPPFQVSAYYILCHDEEETTTTKYTQELYRAIQEIYNTYIMAMRWEFASDCIQAQTPIREPGHTCHQLAQRGFNRLLGRDVPEQQYTPLSSSRRHTPLDTCSRTTAEITPAIPPQRPSKRQKKANSTTQNSSSSQQRCSNITTNLASVTISTVKSGMKKLIEGKAILSRSRQRIQELEKECIGTRENKDKLQETLCRLEKWYGQMSLGKGIEMKLAAWTMWLYAGCIGHILYLNNKYLKNRRACASHMIFSIINLLLPTEGMKALTVLPALGVMGHVLCSASEKRQEDQHQICAEIAHGLRGSLTLLPDDCELFIPAGLISKVANISIYDAYRSLGMHNLSILGVYPDCNPTDAEISITMKQIRDGWSNFEWDVSDRIATLRQILQLFEAGSFEEMGQLAQSSSLKDSADFLRLQREVNTTDTEHFQVLLNSMTTLIATEFGRIVVWWLEQRTQSEILPESSTILDTADSGVFMTQQSPPSLSLGMLLQAAHHTDGEVVQLAVDNSFDGYVGTQASGGDHEDYGWMSDVCDFGNIVLSTPTDNGNLT